MITKLVEVCQRLLAHRRLPIFLTLLAAVSMLPALKVGLFGDDLVQRPAQLKPTEFPPHLVETGFVPPNSGELTSVVSHLFDYLGRPEAIASARDYGIAPWWMLPSWGAALWRPLTAFTHWLDYRLFPNSPALMHAHNIFWYAAAVFLAALCYRKMFEVQRTGAPDVSARSDCGHVTAEEKSEAHFAIQLAASWDVSRSVATRCLSGLAAFLFLFDKDNYGPVAYVANRGFVIALTFGLGCLYAHHRWRSAHSKGSMFLSALCLLLSLLANEGGASTLAFLLGYALAIESGCWRSRLATLAPAAGVMVIWRAVYVWRGSGVRHFVGYIDPGYNPLRFLENLLPRMNGLLGGQLTGIPPEIDFGLSPEMRIVLAIFFAAFSMACAFAFLPIVRQDRVARYWAIVMVLALVPAATVVPLSKNLGFVAVGAFGLIASFLQHFGSREHRLALPVAVRAISWVVASWLVIAHVFGAIVARVGLAALSPYVPEAWEQLCAFESEIGERDVIIVNDPAESPVVVPFDRAYRGQALPKSMRTLAPGLAGLVVTRPDDRSLVITSKSADLFDCPDLGPIHLAYALKAGNDYLFGGRVWHVGDCIASKGLVAEVLELSSKGLPRSVKFRFEQSLDSENRVWLYFDWPRHAHLPFVLPRIGEAAQLSGPRGWHGEAAP